MLYSDTISNVLYIDLSTKHFWIKQRADVFEKYLGGTGAATALLSEECPKGVTPFSPDNPIILSVGPLTALFPLASKTVAMFKSPHTENLGESHCGGRSAVAIRMAGYGAIVIKGASDTPVYLAIHGDKIYFRDAATLWGIQNSFTVGRIIRENEPGAGFRTIMRIGGAGEKLVPYACVTTETYRHFGRLGLGAVFGSKKLKAIVISGKRSLTVADKNQYRLVYDEIFESSTSSPIMKKYHDLGTAGNVMPLNSIGALPTRNLNEQRFDAASNISGETITEQYLGRRLACSHCPVGCIHIAALREQYLDQPYFYKTSMISYDYEPIFAIGSMLGIGEAAAFFKLMERIEIYGLDVMSTGVVLAWATEAFKRGLISEKETRGLGFDWGGSAFYMDAVKYIVEQPNEFYKHLAQGVEKVSSVYGGKDFALSFGGNEMSGYNTGPAAYAGILVGARHSHLDNAGYSVDQKNIDGNYVKSEDVATTLIEEERWRQILSSLVVCFFARAIYTPDLVSRALKSIGFNYSPADLILLGHTIHAEKYKYKIREGFDLDKLRLPKRILEINTPSGQLHEQYIRDVIKNYKNQIGS